jgi:hypothetical protein
MWLAKLPGSWCRQVTIHRAKQSCPADRANAVRLAFEKAFADNGWTIVKSKQDLQDQEWDYTAAKGLRRVKVEVEAQEPDEGTGTEFSIEVE